MWEFTSPRNIVFGEDSLEYLDQVPGERAMIVCGKTVAGLGIADQVAEMLQEGDMEVEIFDEVEPEPSMETMDRGGKRAILHQPDWIIGLGGGSSMDAAKCIWVKYELPDFDLESISPFERLDLRRKADLACIPTTSGSGSEVTWATLITDRERGVKLELASRELVPDLVILEPALTVSMSPQLTAATGMDALAHAVEAYSSQWANEFSDGLALEAIETTFEYLPLAYEDGEDLEAREKMQIAATKAGIAFSNSQIGLAHAMAHALGGLFEVSHGKAVGLLLPYVIEFSGEEAMGRYSVIADVLEVLGEDVPQHLAAAVTSLLEEIDLPRTLSDLGIEEDKFEERMENLVERTMNSTGIFVSPRIPDEEEVRGLLYRAYRGERVLC